MPARGSSRTSGEDETGGLYTMAVASRLTGMHPQTLRKYERAGLITPSRQAGNQRLYSEADVRRLRRIRYLVEVRGVNIAGLELTLGMSDRLDELGADATRAQLRQAIDDVTDMSRQRERELGGRVSEERSDVDRSE